jgi:CheY-like chemotaxis protein
MDLTSILEQAGFDVEEASNFDEALSKLNGGGCRIDALVTDVQMPGAIIPGLTKPSPLAKPVSPDHLLGAVRSGLKALNR